MDEEDTTIGTNVVEGVEGEDAKQNISPSTSDAINNTYVRNSGENISSSVRHRHVTEIKICEDCDQPICTRCEREEDRPMDRQELGELRRSMDTIIYLLVFIVVLMLVLFLTQTAVHYTNKEKDRNALRKSFTAMELAINNVSNQIKDVHPCPDGWIRSGLSKCFREVCERLTWAAAQTYCIEIGGTLASFQNTQEMVSLFAVLRSCDVISHGEWNYYIGGFKKDEVWMWKGETTDTEMTFTAWFDGEPVNRTDLRCAISYPSRRAWKAFSCTEKFQFICERSI